MKSYVIPNYAGFIPGSNGNSELGRTATKISRRCFVKEDKFQKGHTRWQSNGFLEDQKTFDSTRPNFFRGYGKTTMLEPHPCYNEDWSTTFRKTYLKPQERTKPNAHIKLAVNECTFDE